MLIMQQCAYVTLTDSVTFLERYGSSSPCKQQNTLGTPTGIPFNTMTLGASGSATAVASSSPGSDQNSLAIGLGVGLSSGAALLIIIVGLLLLRRRRCRRTQKPVISPVNNLDDKFCDEKPVAVNDGKEKIDNNKINKIVKVCDADSKPLDKSKTTDDEKIASGSSSTSLHSEPLPRYTETVEN
jgi:hypothetical protein